MCSLARRGVAAKFHDAVNASQATFGRNPLPYYLTGRVEKDV